MADTGNVSEIAKKQKNKSASKKIQSKNDSKPVEVIDDGIDDEQNNLFSPGRLRGKSELLLETKNAQMIFEGRKKTENKHPIIGLKTFAGYLRAIWNAHSGDDPYGDWWLLKVERSIEENNKWMDSEIEKYTALLNKYKNLNHEVAHSIAPITRELNFSIPYSFHGAMLLMKHDELTKIVMTAHHVGLLDTHSKNRIVDLSARAVRTSFNQVTGFRFTSVTREDINSNNPVAQKATELMGPIPSGIQDGDVYPSFESGIALNKRMMRNSMKRMEEAQIKKKEEREAAAG